MTITLELQEQITNAFMDWFGNKMAQLSLSIQMTPMTVSENFKSEIQIFLDDLSKRYIRHNEQSSEAIDCLKHFVKQYPNVSIVERQKAALMCQKLLLLFGIVRKFKVIEIKTTRG